MDGDDLDPNSGADSGQATAMWVKLDTSNLANLTLADSGTIGGEDIATGTYTTFPSIAVNAAEVVVVGFSASAQVSMQAPTLRRVKPGAPPAVWWFGNGERRC